MEWWKQAVIYQIYPKSFQDSNHDGWGDIQGIISRLVYLKSLGVSILWITPMYVSPQKDNGYDIADYDQIDPRFGTMEDFDELLKQAHALDMHIMMDVVVNHTSTEHRWFQSAKEDSNSPYRDYYIIKEGTPNNWVSMFGGSAWEPMDEDHTYLHLFDVSQADLNWECEDLRRDIYKMMQFWLEKGVDGLRLDVINLISKQQDFVNDREDAGAKGKRFYANGPRMHEFLKEMNQEVFSHYPCVTVGEMMSMTPELGCEYTNPEHKELAMIFSFQHLKVDYANGDRWTRKKADIREMKNILSLWQTKIEEGNGWNSLVWSNHDQPRVLSRFGDEGIYRKESAKLLATSMHMLKGTPYIYQGEEIGMVNAGFSAIEQYNDVESIHIYHERVAQGIEQDIVMDGIAFQSRDNARTPMQWDHEPYHGFSDATPWLSMGTRGDITVSDAIADRDSVFYHYQKLIALRKQETVMVEGVYQLLSDSDDEIWSYTRTLGNEVWLVVNNFSNQERSYSCTLQGTYRCEEIILSNYVDSSKHYQAMSLRPYESIVYRLYKLD